MDTLEFAKSLEKEGKEFYEKCAKDSPFKELAGIFLVLAKEEQRHFDLFTALQKKQVLPPTTDISSSKEAKKVFAGLSKNFSFPDDVYSYTETYEKALDIERNSILLYEDMLAKATSVEEKKLLVILIEEEQKHEHLLEHLIEFVNEPNVFLENAEFNHLDS